jgi:hypothetical protein
MMLAVRVVVHPLEPGIASDFAPRELGLRVSPVPLFVVVVLYMKQFPLVTVKLVAVLQV